MKIEINNLTKAYGNNKAVNNLTLTLDDGIYGILGPNVPRYEQKTLSIT